MIIIPSLPSRTSQVQISVSYALAAFLTVLLVLQLYTYDGFIEASSVLLPVAYSPQFATLLPAIVVIVEIVALCYALPIYLSRFARFLARAAALLTPIMWAFLLWLPLARGQTGLYPLFGAKVPLSIDLVSIIPSIVLMIMTIVLVYLDSTRRHS